MKEEENEQNQFYGFKSGRAPPPEGKAVIQKYLDRLLDMAKYGKLNSLIWSIPLISALSDISASTELIDMAKYGKLLA